MKTAISPALPGCLTLVLWLATAALVFAGADEDWRAIEALDAGPQTRPRTVEQARTVTLEHLARQEKALRGFAAAYPGEPRAFEARLRLAHVLAMRSRFEDAPKLLTAAEKVLDELASAAPPARRADVAFARIALLMKTLRDSADPRRDRLAESVDKFRRDFPDDRRLGALLAETATLFDSEPRKKRELLEQAQRHARDADTRQRIADDFKRLDQLGKPVALKFTSVQGEPVDLAACRGQVVAVCFFASWSVPSVAHLNEVRALAKNFPKLRVIGISLDKDRAELDAVMKDYDLRWPVHFDGKGWESPLVRALGINTLPTLWLIDRTGRLRTLNASRDAAATVRQLLREEP